MASTLVNKRAQYLLSLRTKLDSCKLSDKTSNVMNEMVTDISRAVPECILNLYNSYLDNSKNIHELINKIELYSNRIEELEKKEKARKESLSKTEEKLETGRTTTGIITAVSGVGAAAALAAPAIVAVTPVMITAAVLSAGTILSYNFHYKFAEADKEIKQTLDLPGIQNDYLPSVSKSKLDESQVGRDAKNWYRSKRKREEVPLEEVVKELYKAFQGTLPLQTEAEKFCDSLKSDLEALEGRIRLYDQSTEKCGVISTLVGSMTDPLKKLGLLKDISIDFKGNEAKRPKTESEK